MTLAVATGFLLSVALFAGYVRAGQATRVDPTRALRWEEGGGGSNGVNGVEEVNGVSGVNAVSGTDHSEEPRVSLV